MEEKESRSSTTKPKATIYGSSAKNKEENNEKEGEENGSK